MIWILIGLTFGALLALGEFGMVGERLIAIVSDLRERSLSLGMSGESVALEYCRDNPTFCPSSAELLLQLTLLSLLPALLVLLAAGVAMVGREMRSVALLAGVAFVVVAVLSLGVKEGGIVAVGAIVALILLRMLIGVALLLPAAALTGAVVLTDLKLLWRGESGVYAEVVGLLARGVPAGVPGGLINILGVLISAAPLVAAVLILLRSPLRR